MPRPIPVPVRHAIWRRFLNGQDSPTIAAALGLAQRTVQQLIRRFRQGGQDAVMPSYDGCGTATPKPSEALVQAALGLRREHPTWGAGLIRVMLQRHGPELDPPTTRTLQRWLLRAGLAPAPAGRRSAADSRRATLPHEVWQMDAAEQVPLRTGQRVSWLRIADECSGGVLWTEVFPPRPLERGPAAGRPGAVAAGIHSLGAPPAVPGRQRGAVGFGRRPAH
jgi:Homeodomain-like domain-containing protein